MVHLISFFVLVALIAASSAYPRQQFESDSPVFRAYELDGLKRAPHEFSDEYLLSSPQEIYELHRARRSVQAGGHGPRQAPGKSGGWSVNPDLKRDDSGNTKGRVEVNHKGKNHDFNAGWGKVIRGPNKAKPTWHVGGSYKW